MDMDYLSNLDKRLKKKRKHSVKDELKEA